MRVPYKWLQKYIKVSLEPEELAEKLTMAGLTVDVVETLDPGFSGVVVGQVIALNPHPYADNLLICQIDIGSHKVQLVTGAPNVSKGQMVAVALKGSKLPGGQEIDHVSFRGIASEGMLCSAQELGINTSLVSPEDREGIISLPADSVPGTDVTAALGLDDIVLVLDLTPNRADCLSIINVAREVAAITGTPLQLPKFTTRETGQKAADLINIEIQASDLCARYVARIVQGVHIGSSPAWLQACLRAAGIRPINNIVDITNFIMLEMGQPLHAFDYDCLRQQQIVVRRSKGGEKLTTLDEIERELDPEMLLIADAAGPVAIAGVMGGLDTEVTAATANILIEAAHFDAASVRRTSQRLGLRSESSMRFGRGVDIEGAAAAADRAAQLMLELAGGQVAQGKVDCYVRPYQPVNIDLRPERVNYLLGTGLTPAVMKKTLERLHLPVRLQGQPPVLTVKVPAYRGDITQEIDLVEEIARLYGYDKIPVTLPGNITAREKRTLAQRREEAGREAAAASGLTEIITYSFIGPQILDQLQLPIDHPWRRTVKIRNPLREDQSLMRPSLLPGLLGVAVHSAGHRVMPLAVYELGRVFIPSGELLPQEMLRLAGLVMGNNERGWDWPAGEMDFFYLKGIVTNILSRLRLGDITWEGIAEHPFLHPGRQAAIKAGETILGYLGELHPDVLTAMDLPERACVFELDWESVTGAMPSKTDYRPVPRFPAVERDLAVVVAAEFTAAAVSEVIKGAGGTILQDHKLFDAYQGHPVPEGYKSLAYSLFFQHPQRTLTDVEVNISIERIKTALKKKLQAVLRQQ